MSMAKCISCKRTRVDEIDGNSVCSLNGELIYDCVDSDKLLDSNKWLDEEQMREDLKVCMLPDIQEQCEAIDPEVQREIECYNALPVEFEDFIELPELSDGGICLVCASKSPAIPEKKWVPSYDFIICKNSERIGEINLRIGYTDGLYYGGQIGYGIDEQYRGNGYAGRACRLLLPVAKAHKMVKLLITNNQTNTASMRVCEKLGARLVRVARLPQWHDLHKEGRRFSNIYEWDVEH